MPFFDPEFGEVDPTSVLRGDSKVDSPVAEWSSGRFEQQSPVWSAWPGVIWFHESVVEKMVGLNLRGFSSYPVSLVGKDGSEISGYRGLVILGRCGPIQPERSLSMQADSKEGGTSEVKGLFFEEESWDRSDIFMCESYTAHVFFSERAKKCLESVLSNVEFQSVEEVVWMHLR